MADRPHPMRPWCVEIIGKSGGGIIQKTVFARTSRDALKQVIEFMPLDHEAWQWAGWQVQVFEEYRAFIVEAKVT